MNIFLIVVAFLGLAIIGMAIRLFFFKGAEFRGTCATKNPLLQEEGAACGVCGKMPGEACGEE